MTNLLNEAFDTKYEKVWDILDEKIEIEDDFQAVDVPFKMEIYQNDLSIKSKKRVVKISEWRALSSRCELVKAVCHRDLLKWNGSNLYVSCDFGGMILNDLKINSRTVKPIFELPSGRVLYQEDFSDESFTVIEYNLDIFTTRFWMKWIMENELRSNLLIRFPSKIRNDADGIEVTFPPNEDFLDRRDVIKLWNGEQVGRTIIVNRPSKNFVATRMLSDERSNSSWVLTRRQLKKNFFEEDGKEIERALLGRYPPEENPNCKPEKSIMDEK
jgi:hypothetical protein